MSMTHITGTITILSGVAQSPTSMRTCMYRYAIAIPTFPIAITVTSTDGWRRRQKSALEIRPSMKTDLSGRLEF
jgi:hypothetical protein